MQFKIQKKNLFFLFGIILISFLIPLISSGNVYWYDKIYTSSSDSGSQIRFDNDTILWKVIITNESTELYNISNREVWFTSISPSDYGNLDFYNLNHDSILWDNGTYLQDLSGNSNFTMDPSGQYLIFYNYTMYGENISQTIPIDDIYADKYYGKREITTIATFDSLSGRTRTAFRDIFDSFGFNFTVDGHFTDVRYIPGRADVPGGTIQRVIPDWIIQEINDLRLMKRAVIFGLIPLVFFSTLLLLFVYGKKRKKK